VLDSTTPAHQMKTAQASDWKRKELPPEKCTLSIGRRFTLAEMEQVRRGSIPEQMEDKWFVYWENNTLYFHRSWTGICIYIARFHEERDGYVMRDADVNRDPEQYQTTSDDEDLRLLSVLIDVVLLRLPLEPLPGEDIEDAALKAWAQLGRASHGKYPETPPDIQLISGPDDD
jgi:hypothetical protein